MPRMTADRDARARAWAVALRSGATATWAEFRADTTAAPGPAEGPVPGSAQLELVRRLGLHAAGLSDFAALAELVLSTASPGRGLVDTPLPWPGEERAFGTPAIEPELLPADELVRAATAVLIRLLVEQPSTPVPRPRGQRWWRRGFVVLGAPGTAEVVRDALLEAGWREGGRRARYLVLGGPLVDMMAERWVDRLQAGGEIRWARAWRVAASRDRIPARLHLPEVAARLAAEHGPDRVHVILGDDPQTVLAAVSAALRVELAVDATSPTDVVGADLLRRLNPLLALAVGPEARTQVVAGPWTSARAAVRPVGCTQHGLAVPEAARRWAAATADRIAAELRAAGAAGDYAVHGDPALVAEGLHLGTEPTDPDRPTSVDPADVLELALAMIAELWDQAKDGTD